MSEAEKQEFMEQYEKIHVALMRFCIVKSYGIMDPKDLANDTLLVGLENYHKLENKQALLSYLMSTANNICKNHLRRKKFSGPYDEGQANNMEDHSSGIEEKVDVTVLYEALEKLPPLQKEAVILFEISDLPIKEIMVIQNSGESAVKQRIKRGREKLAELMQEKDRRRKIAVATSLLFTTNAFGMTNLDHYFNAIKEIPLPLTQQEAVVTIGKYKLGAAASKSVVSASVKSTLLVKKGLVGITLLTAGITTAVFLSSNREDSAVTDKVEQAIVEVPVENSPEIDETTAMAPLSEEEVQLPIALTELELTESESREILNLINEGKIDVSDLEEEMDIPFELIEENVPLIPVSDQSGIGDDELFQVQGVKTVFLNHLGDELIIKTWEESTVKVEGDHIVETKDPDDKALLLEKLQCNTEQKGDVYEVSTDLCQIKSVKKKSTYGPGTITFRDNGRVKFKKLKTRYIVTVPSNTNLIVKGSYETLEIPDVNGSLTVQVHDTRATIGEIGKDADLKFNYSKVVVGDIGGDAHIRLFDSNMEMGSSKDLELSCKYSKIKGTEIGNLEVSMFEGTIEYQKIDGDIEGSLKYGDFTCGSDVGDMTITSMFESKVMVGKIGKFKGSIKYSKFESDGVEEFKPETVFESDLVLGKVGSFETGNSKYSDYEIAGLTKGIKVLSYEDDIRIEEVGLSVKYLDFSGRYTDYDIELAEGLGMQIESKMNYGSFSSNGLSLEVTNNEKRNQMKTMKGKISGGTKDSPKITFDCYECTVNLEAAEI